MRAIGRTAALAALVGAGALAGSLVLSPDATGSNAAPSAPLIARASFDPSAPAFGDRISATITVEIDRSRARSQTLRVSYDLDPLQRIGPPRTVRVTRGDVELVTIAVPVACISDACLAAPGVAQLRLAPTKASIATATGVRSVSVAWPPLAVRDRVRAADVNAVEPPVEADASPLPPTYRASPATLATTLDVVAALLGVSAVGLAVWELLIAWRRRRAPEAALVRAIRLARSAPALSGPERRRALELLARALGRGELHRRATALAWSQPTPEPAESESSVAAIEREETPWTPAPLADAVELRRSAWPARLLTALLAAAAIGCTVAALLVALIPRTRTLVPLGRNANAVLVLDLSASISADSFSRIAATLRALAMSSGRFALVIFSDFAYEALPPGIPAVDLTPLIRFFTVPPQRGSQAAPIFPPNPWADTFTGGTTISSGMQIALQIALAQQPRPTVILVSDLGDNPADLPALAGVLADDRRDRVPVRVVGLNPAPQDVAFFTTLLGGDAGVTYAPTLGQVAPQHTTPFPWALAALALVAAVTLGLREGWAPKLDWRES